MTQPRSGTPEYRLWLAAIDVAASPPLKQGKYAGNAGVYWPLIHELREALDELGVDWRKVTGTK